MPARLLTAELIAVGSELTVGETRDTNSGELAGDLTREGVAVQRLTALPDQLEVVRDALAAALTRSDLVVTTGGLGPTPDDLTREAVAGALDEQPVVDPDLEGWLRGLWARRGIPFPPINLKQAWLIPSAQPIANPNGTAPGWWVTAPGGRFIVTLPGPPREMRPMWRDDVLPRLRARGLGRPSAVRTLRLAGIGESQVADLLGDALLRAANPTVATYARADAVDIRIAARGDGSDEDAGVREAEAIAARTEEHILALLGGHVWARGAVSWADAIGAAVGPSGGVGIVEYGTAGSFAALLGDVPWLLEAERHAGPGPLGRALEDEARRLRGIVVGGADAAAPAALGVAISARPRGGDTVVHVAVAGAGDHREHRERRLVFLAGTQGRMRAALAAADIVLGTLSPRVSDARPGRGPRGAR